MPAVAALPRPADVSAQPADAVDRAVAVDLRVVDAAAPTVDAQVLVARVVEQVVDVSESDAPVQVGLVQPPSLWPHA